MIYIADEIKCSGCAACAQICHKGAITLIENVEGFLYPQVDQSACVNCGSCEKICPVLSPPSEKQLLSSYAAKNKDEQIRKNSSSGGLFYSLAKDILKEGGVVFGAEFDENWNVFHNYISDIDDIYKFQGSKYVQSDIGHTFLEVKKFLKEKRKVLFTGTPCQVNGLAAFLRKDDENLFTVELCCHGVPSRKVWRKYVAELRRRNNEIKSLTFRDKSNGWRNYSLAFTYKNNQGKINSFCESKLINPYMKGFLHGLYCRPICSACPFKSFATASDIIIGDFWGVDYNYQDLNDNKGISLIIGLTKKGVEMIEKKSLDLALIEITKEDVCRGNGNFMHSTPMHPKREKFWKLIEKEDVAVVVTKCLKRSFYQRGISFLKRSIYGKK